MILNENLSDAIKELPTNRVPIAVGKAVVGAAEAIVSPFVEVAHELVDEIQIAAYYVTGGRFDVELTSDLMKAFEHGATRTEVLKGMAEGLIGTPGRLLKAVEDGDWEAVGKEAVNLYLLVEMVKASPKYLRQVPALFATAQKALRLVRLRTLGFRLKGPRLTVPEAPPVPREPVYLGHDPAARAVGPIPRYGPPTTPPRLPDSPEFLADPPAHAPKPLDSPPGPPKLVPYSAVVQLRRSVPRGVTHGREEAGHYCREGGIQRRAGFHERDGVLTVYRDSIFNLEEIPNQGKLIQAAFEEAAQAAARAVGATSLRVALGTVLNHNWAEYLTRRGYFPDTLGVSPEIKRAC